MCTCEKVCKSYIKDTSLDSIKNRNKNDNTNIIITAEQNNIININITNQSNKSNKHINITNEDDKKTIKKINQQCVLFLKIIVLLLIHF